MGINCFWDFPQQILVKMAQSNKKRREEQKRRLEEQSLQKLPTVTNILKYSQLTYCILSGLINVILIVHLY